MKKLIAIIAAATVLWSSLIGYELAAGRSYNASELYRVVRPAVVQIFTIPGDMKGSLHSGTGFFIAADGTLVTAAHVVYDDPGPGVVSLVIVRAADGAYYMADIIHIDLEHDIAVLKVTMGLTMKDTVGKNVSLDFGKPVDMKKKFDYLPLASDDKFYAGEKIATIGYPDLYMCIYTVGMVSSAEAQAFPLKDSDTIFRDLVVTSMLVFPGNSGGPVFDDHGRVVGIITLGMRVPVALAFYQRVTYVRRILAFKGSEQIAFKKQPCGSFCDEK